MRSRRTSRTSPGPAYIVGTVRITDPERFAAYGQAIRGLSAEFGGESVVAGAVSAVLEGESPVDEGVVVALAFSTAPAALSLAASAILARWDVATVSDGRAAAGRKPNAPGRSPTLLGAIRAERSDVFLVVPSIEPSPPDTDYPLVG